MENKLGAYSTFPSHAYSQLSIICICIMRVHSISFYAAVEIYTLAGGPPTVPREVLCPLSVPSTTLYTIYVVSVYLSLSSSAKSLILF